MFIRITKANGHQEFIENHDDTVTIFFGDKDPSKDSPDIAIDQVGILGGERGAEIRFGGPIGSAKIALRERDSIKAVIQK